MSGIDEVRAKAKQVPSGGSPRALNSKWLNALKDIGGGKSLEQAVAQYVSKNFDVSSPDSTNLM